MCPKHQILNYLNQKLNLPTEHQNTGHSRAAALLMTGGGLEFRSSLSQGDFSHTVVGR